MDDAYHSMIGVADLVCTPLYTSTLGPNFHRGPHAADGTSFFVGEDISSPVQLSVIGEVKATYVNDNGPMLVLGRPELCSEMMYFYWHQEISALERIELHDDFVDHRLGICPCIKRWIHHSNGGNDTMLIYMFFNYTSVKVIDKLLQTVDGNDVNNDIVLGDVIHCRVVLGSQQELSAEVGHFQHYFIFALSVDRLQQSTPDNMPLDHWQCHLLESNL
ncbi:hypothetical protein L208DRAFT_1467269 [Tricholoma matsutake]|nr:hypothetical protein L208DRAFT_1467269 [Tricholoma matsutake 945]